MLNLLFLILGIIGGTLISSWMMYILSDFELDKNFVKISFVVNFSVQTFFYILH